MSQLIGSSVAIVLSMVFTTMFGVLGLWQLANGMVTSAASQGARAGSRVDVASVGECQDRARQALVNLLPGVGDSAQIVCSEEGGVVSASVRVTVGGGIPPFSTVTLSANGSSRKEVAP